MGTATWNSADFPVEKDDGFRGPTERKYVKYVPVGYANSHSMLIGYLLWVIGFTGAHRFYFGKPLTGVLWFFTGGLLGIGWLVDVLLIPSMDREANSRFRLGGVDYNVAWVLLVFLGIFGFHRFYQGKILTGLLYLISGGLLGIGIIYDVLTLNEQIDELHAIQQSDSDVKFFGVNY